MPPLSESLRTRWFRFMMNCWPCYRGTGARISFISSDWNEVRVRLPLNLRTRNYRGTLFGGSLYGSIDPIYMLMLIKRLGPEYIVWDKSANIRFMKPGRTTLTARFSLDDQEIQAIKSELSVAKSIDRIYPVDLVDHQGVVHASASKTIFIKKIKKT